MTVIDPSNNLVWCTFIPSLLIVQFSSDMLAWSQPDSPNFATIILQDVIPLSPRTTKERTQFFR